MAMEIITTQKGGEALIWQGCKFTFNRKMVNGKKYWKCAKRICPARITTEGNEVLQQIKLMVTIIQWMGLKLKWRG